MPAYSPLKIDIEVNARNVTIDNFRWKDGRLSLDFIDETNKFILRSSFRRCEIVRMVDQLSIADEEMGGHIGIVPMHLAYSVEGSAFWRLHEPMFKQYKTPPTHFRFLTPNSCVDVISTHHPIFNKLSIA